MTHPTMLDACITEFAKNSSFSHIDKDIQFEYFCALQISKQSETTFTEIEDAITDGGNDGGIDCFLVLVNDQCINTKEDLDEIKITSATTFQIIIIQSKISPKFREATFNNWISSWPNICDLSKNTNQLLTIFNASLVEKIELFRHVWTQATIKHAPLSIDFRYCTKAESAVVNGVINSKRLQFCELVKDSIKNCPITVELLSTTELMELYSLRPTQNLELVFETDPTSISLTRDKYGYVGVVRLWEYLNFISDTGTNKIRESIFESNIRHFLGEVDVNKKIGDTLKNDKENDFWWFNNGITIIAEKVAQLPKVLHLENVSIINGLQTSFTIYEQRDIITKDDPRTVLVKVIRSTDKVVVDKIINASNFQNPVPPVLLRATDPVQRDIENYCLTQGYFYDRRKGYYKNQGKPANHIFTIQEMAQAIKAILFFDAATARRSPTTIIKTDNSYHSIFDSTKPFPSFLKAARIVQKVRYHISNSLDVQHRNLGRNLTFYIARVLTAQILNKNKYTHDEVANIDVDLLSIEQFQAAFNTVNLILEKYTEESNENMINAIKSNKFNDLVNSSLVF